MIRLTRLVIVSPDGERVEDDSGPDALDLTRIPNADARAPMGVRVEQQCDLGHWHWVGGTALPLYDVGGLE